MAKIIFIIGIPGSGKTTLAKKMVAETTLSNGAATMVRVNKDDLRSMLHDGHFSKPNEEVVRQLETDLIVSALFEGKTVIIDNTGTMSPKVRERILFDVRKRLDVDIDVEFNTDCIGVPPSVCIDRDSRRERSVGKKAIIDWWRNLIRFGYDPRPTYVAPVANLARVGICDIDGTLAHMNDRSPYDWSKVGTDTCDEAVRMMLMGMKHQLDKIVFLSGRSGICYEETLEWLQLHVGSLGDFDLFMREAGDRRADTVVKHELFYNHIHGVYDPVFVIDDRVSVCEMWRWEIGLKVFQVGYPEVPF